VSTTPAVDLSTFNLFDPAVQQCPFPHYEAIREQHAVFNVPGTDIYLVTRHELITPILRDIETFSSGFQTTGMLPSPDVVAQLREIMATGYQPVATMLTVDPPLHTRYRSTVAPYFTPRRIAELRAPVEAICERLIDAWINRDAIEVVKDFAVPLPIEAIAYVLNVPTDKMADFKRWSDDSVATIGTKISDERRYSAARGIVEFQHYFADQLEQRRIHPTGDLLSDLAKATIPTDEGGTRTLEMGEMLSITQQLLVAGNETTTKSITEAVRLLAEHPERWAQLKADPSLAGVFTEEVLRMSTPTQGMFRIVTKDTTIDGVAVPAGARLVLMYAAANRDPSVFADPDVFDPMREQLSQHLAFGKGIHFCIGAPLSRLEIQVALSALARRVDTLTLLESNTFEYFPSFMLRGLTSLDVGITRSAP
jgi:cytochrome P450